MRDAGATTRRRTGRTQPDAGLHRPRRLGIRMRLTLTYAGLVTTSGTVLIAMVYLYTRLVTFNIQFDLPPQGTGTAPTSGMQIKVPSEATRVDTNLLDLLTSVLRSAVVALVLLAVVSGTVGWVLAGRMLRPLSSMNAVANRAASGDLSQRLALSGPRDEIHDLADTFDRMLDSLERSFAAHRRFAANASHELRTPLATTQTMIDVALADPDASVEDLRALMRRVWRTNRANVETIDALLDLADAQSGSLAHEEVDLEAVVLAELAATAPQADEHDVSVHHHLGAAVLHGDPVLLRQAVSNLLRNAVRYNTPGGRVKVALAQETDAVRLTIRNDGPVVPADKLDSLREPFVRGEGRGRTRGSGHGLGLAIVSAVALAHHGTLELRANPGGGLTAVLALPVPGPVPGAGDGTQKHTTS